MTVVVMLETLTDSCDEVEAVIVEREVLPGSRECRPLYDLYTPASSPPSTPRIASPALAHHLISSINQSINQFLGWPWPK